MGVSVFIYFTFYLIGIVLGSFFTLAIYRIPLKQDITHTRSYCPKCNHRLNFWDLIPVLSYLFLGGKCRYCNNIISKRYILIENMSGLLYLLFVISLRIDFLQITIFDISKLLYSTFMFSVLFILGGIAKESKIFSTKVFNFGVIIQTIYIIYLCILRANIYRYIIYILIIVLLQLIKNFIKNEKNKKIINLMVLVIFTTICASEYVGLINLFFIALLLIIKKIFNIKINSDLIFNVSFLTIISSIILSFIVNYY